MKPKHDSLDGINRVNNRPANPHKYNHSPQASVHHVPQPISGQSHDINTRAICDAQAQRRLREMHNTQTSHHPLFIFT